LLVLVVALGTTLLAPAQALARSCEFYGGQSPDSDLSHTKSVSMGSLRGGLFLPNGGQTWNASTFAPYDQSIALAYQKGISYVGLINSQSVPADPGSSGWNAPPDTSDGRNAYVQQFVDVTKTLMTRYGDMVKYWEIWNEPNHCNAPDDHLTICESMLPDPGATFIRPDIYAKILAETYVQNHDLIVQKGLHLVSGGIYAHDVNGDYVADDYLRAFYGNGVWAWMGQNYGRNYPWDAFAFHVYTTLWQPGDVPASTIQDYLQQLATARSAAGDPYPVFITEFGWQVTSQLGEAQQAADIDTSLSVYESSSEVARTYVFRISEWQGWGIFRSDWSATPAVGVYQAHTKGCTPTVLPPLPADAGTGDADSGNHASDAGIHSSDAAGMGDGAGVDDASHTDGDAQGGVEHDATPEPADAGATSPDGGSVSRGAGCELGASASSSACGLVGLLVVAAGGALRRRRASRR